MMITDVALLAGFALAHAGFAFSSRRPMFGGLVLETGIGIAFLAKGLLGPGLLGLTAIALPVLFKTWRTDKYLKTLLITALSALPWLVIWPLLLYSRSPVLFFEWFWTNNFGRFLGENNLGPKRETFLYATTLLTLGFPVFPLSVWSWWKERKMVGQSALLQITLVSFMTGMVVLNISSEGRSLYAQPVFISLCLASLPAATELGGKQSRIASALFVIVFVLFLAGGWSLWTMMMVGWPAAARTLVLQKVPDYLPTFQPWAFAGGVAVTSAAIFCWCLADRMGEALIIKWCTVVGLCYGLVMTLFLPIINSNMSYKTIMTSLGCNLPLQILVCSECGLGEPQRAMIHYYANLRTLRTEVEPGALDICDVMLIQSNYNDNIHNRLPARDSWKLVWEGRHGSRELFRLYFRLPSENIERKVLK